MNTSQIKQILQPLMQRQPNTHKYDYGHVLIVGGSAGMLGAPLLAGKAALRSGAGLVTMASVVAESLEGRVPELMTYVLPEDTNLAVRATLKFIKDRKVNMLSIGPGTDMKQTAFVRKLVRKSPVPVVLDAGAITAFHGHMIMLRNAAKRIPIILTPHDGEFTRLTSETLAIEAGERRIQVQAFAQKNNCILVAKGSHSLVASADLIHSNMTGNPGMATAGSGDVLTGIISGLLGQGIEPFNAAVAGVYLHGLSGDLAADEKTQAGVIASDLINYLPMALSTLQK